MSSLSPHREVPKGTSLDSQDPRHDTSGPAGAGPETPTSAPKETRFDKLLAAQARQSRQLKRKTSASERATNAEHQTIQAKPGRSAFPLPTRPRTKDAAGTEAGPSTFAIPAARHTAAPTSVPTQVARTLGTPNAGYNPSGGSAAASVMTTRELELMSNLYPLTLLGRPVSTIAGNDVGWAVSIPDIDQSLAQNYSLLNPPRHQSSPRIADTTGISEQTLAQQKARGIAREKVGRQRVHGPYDNQDSRDDVYARFNAGQSSRMIAAATNVPRHVLTQWKADGIAAGRVEPEVISEAHRSYEDKRKHAYALFQQYERISLSEVSRITGVSISAVNEWKRTWTSKEVLGPERSDSRKFTRHVEDRKKAEVYELLIQKPNMLVTEAAEKLGVSERTILCWKNKDLAAGTLPSGLDRNRFRAARDPETRKEVESLLRQNVSNKQISELTGVSGSTVKRLKRRKKAAALVHPEEPASARPAASIHPEAPASARPAASPATASNSSHAQEVSETSSDVLLYTPSNMHAHFDEVSSESSAWGNSSTLRR
ncbi:hypothetical protein EPUS_01126 [Endocarpon pusillum Z07020]|uniref:Uncharacterized protein n=1 Tax=Endocarpon pusillum (strain Z07020 / HMAS-L-300199) TaxID=1263415 RepID=U1HJS4_ENDPU|nr:uncharacterized protein EPUS_01126 [Endocarpon pusillum Z07020]ERF69169.1 hypothetical protein EPUS_01126 [Endocarpon pusillum Z07020]